jgi:signal transduction histidine kinase
MCCGKSYRYAPTAITIANRGNEAIQDVFNRYQSEKSSGLGLSIVKSIIELYNMDISYSVENGFHCFEIRRLG